MLNLLKGGGFETEWDGDALNRCLVFTPNKPGQVSYWSARGEVRNAKDWFAWYVHSEDHPPAHDPSNPVGWAEPETSIIHREAPYLDPPRIAEGDGAVKMFTAARIHDGGRMQQVAVVKGQRLRATVKAHAWTGSGHDPRVSEPGAGPINVLEGDAPDGSLMTQATFWIGVDPLGGQSAINPRVVWSRGAHIYNEYAQVPAVEVVAEAEIVTVFIRQRFLWPYAHCDGYTDAASLEVVEEPGPEPDPCPGPVPGGYAAYGMVVDYDIITDPARRLALYTEACGRGVIVGPSHDHICAWPPGAETYTVELPDIPVARRAEFRAWYAARNDGIVIVYPGELPDPQPEPGGGSPSLSPGLHLTMGDSGASDWMRRLYTEHPDVLPPSIKAYGSIATMATLKLFKDIDGRVLTVGRLSQGCDPGVNVEGPNFNGDLLAEAQRVMASSMCAWAPHRAYVDVWEVINEQDPPGVDGHRRMAIFMQHCMDIADLEGYKLGLFGYSLGVPEWEEMQAVAETGVLEQARLRGHYLALHEYDSPLDAHYGQAIPGRPVVANRGAIAFRYRWWEDAVGGAAKMPNVLITELNVDADMRTLDPLEWENQMRWYLEEARKDAYVKGIHVFDWEDGVAWPQFNIKPRMAELWYAMAVTYGAAGGDPEPEPPEPEPPEQPALPVTPYSQRNPLWAKDRMLPGYNTIGGNGCAMNTVAMYGTQVDRKVTPKTLNAWLNKNGGYTTDGTARLYWAKAAEAIPGIKFVQYFTWRTTGADMAQVHRVLATGPVLLEIDFNPGGAQQTHWVLALGFTADGQDIRCIDPWTGQVGTLLALYGDPGWTLQRAIYAMAEYRVIQPARGVHAAPSPDAQANIPDLVSKLTAMEIKWYKLLDQGAAGNVALVQALKVAGIEPVIRLWRGHHLPQPVPDVGNVERLIQAGARYVEVLNEPNLSGEWAGGYSPSWQYGTDISTVREVWMEAARQVVVRGGYVALPAFAPTDRGGVNAHYSSQRWAERFIATLSSTYGTEVRSWQAAGKLWLAVHTVAMARPFDYNPQQSWGWDDMCLQGYKAVRDLAIAAFGPMPVLSTEGGVFSPFHLGQLWPECVRNRVVYAEGTDTPLYDEVTWGVHILAANAAAGIPLCHWHLRDIGNEWDGGGWYAVNGAERAPVGALEA